jgi:hypothetical protein
MCIRGNSFAPVSTILPLYIAAVLLNRLMLSENYIWFVTRLTRLVPLVEQDLQTRLEHPSSPRSLVGLVLLDLWLYMYVL